MNLSDCNFRYLKSIAKDTKLMLQYEGSIDDYIMMNSFKLREIVYQLEDLIERIEKGLD